MAQPTDVAIIGGGAAGASVSYYLSLAGVKSTIIEREGVASQASGYSAGGLNPLQGHEIPGRLSGLAWESYLLHLELWNVLPEETGIGYDGRVISSIRLAFHESDLPELEDTLVQFDDVPGFRAEWLQPEDVSYLEPRATHRAIKGLYTRGNAALDSQKYTLALAEAARKRGSSLISGHVVGLQTGGNRVTAVQLEDDTLPCGHVVFAMGPWSRAAEPWLNTYIPVDPLKGEILRMDLPGEPINHDLSGGGGSIHPKPDGLVWCGATEEWKGFDRSLTDSAKSSLLEGAVRLVPDLAKARLALHTACLRPVTPDWLPIIGRPGDWENVFLATGAGKKGVLLSPGMGKSVAELVCGNETSLPIGEFAPERFAPMV